MAKKFDCLPQMPVSDQSFWIRSDILAVSNASSNHGMLTNIE